MADNSLARNRNDGPDFFADDDPLAELARVVGYDERLVPKPPVAERREPAFNLEDELLREFERYEAPRPHQPASLSANAVTDLAPNEVPEVAPLVAEQGEADMSTAAFHERNQSPGAAEPAWMGELQSSGTASGEDRLGDAQASVEEPGNAFVQDLALVAGNGNDAEVAFSHLDEAASSEVAFSPDPFAAVAPDAVAVEPVRDEVAAPTLDLSDELELALGAVQVPQPEPESRSQRKPIYTPGFRMPLANFNPVNDAPRAQPLREQPPQRVEPLFDEVSEPLEVAPLLPSAEPVGTELAEPPVLEASKAAPAQELVADSFDGYLIEPQAPVAHESFVVTPELPASEHVTVEADTQFLADSSPVVEPARPVISEPRLDLPFHLKADPFSPMSPVAPNVAAPRAPAAEEPGLDEDFELALDDLELDLSEMLSDEDLHGFSEPKPTVAEAPAPMPASPSVAAVAAAPQGPQRVTASWSPIARVVPTPAPVAPLVAAPALVTASPLTAASPPVAEPMAVAAAADPVFDLAFDPTQIAETEEKLEPVIELDVPDLQIDEPEPTAEFHSDYEYDLDAELASLLQPAAPETAEPSQSEQQDAVAQPQPAVPSHLDLDDFERALEEDFRRSLTTPLPPHQELEATSSRVGSRFVDASARPRAAALALPLAIFGLVVAGGSVGYAVFGGDGSSVASGEPVVIAADTDPVKILPKDPGGKTVPNQDKAVYDRVAGQVPEAPKQEALISSSEEPVDVVQKTLMTDQFPLEGEDMADASDAISGDAFRDDRLMPDEQQASAPADAGQAPVAVMPRRVKTMIVRPDGTLVEQEIAVAPEPVTPAASSAELGKVAAASVKSVEVASVPDAPADPAAASESQAGIVPVSTSPDAKANDVTAPAAALASAAEAPVLSAPVPTTRPAAQASNAMAATATTPAATAVPAATAAPAPEATQVAAVAPGDYVIQIASLPSAADAEKSYKNLSAKFSSVIGGRGVDIREAQIAGKGTFYRVRIPAGSKNDAVALCERYRAAGGSCLVAK